tara:strand:+ start:576 stop:1442 length:867 start_codon:yes stop_codon:yes gene_type:complete
MGLGSGAGLLGLLKMGYGAAKKGLGAIHRGAVEGAAANRLRNEQLGGTPRERYLERTKDWGISNPYSFLNKERGTQAPLPVGDAQPVPEEEGTSTIQNIIRQQNRARLLEEANAATDAQTLADLQNERNVLNDDNAPPKGVRQFFSDGLSSFTGARDEILPMQRLLIDEGFLSEGEDDGKWGPKSLEAYRNLVNKRRESAQLGQLRWGTPVKEPIEEQPVPVEATENFPAGEGAIPISNEDVYVPPGALIDGPTTSAVNPSGIYNPDTGTVDPSGIYKPPFGKHPWQQ